MLNMTVLQRPAPVTKTRSQELTDGGPFICYVNNDVAKIGVLDVIYRFGHDGRWPSREQLFEQHISAAPFQMSHFAVKQLSDNSAIGRESAGSRH